MVAFFILEYVVYILYSQKYNKTYTGYTSDLVNRIQSHNHFATKGYTYKYRPWKVIYLEFYSSKKDAIARERFLKSGIGRAWLKDTLRL